MQFASDIDLDMTSLIQAGKTKRGRPPIIDNQHFSYVSNGPGSQKVYNWRFSNMKCDATLELKKFSKEKLMNLSRRKLSSNVI